MLKDIREQIDGLYEQLEQAIVPGVFTLNPEAVRIQEEIDALQAQCEHHFVEGQCEYCHAEAFTND